MTIFNTSRCNNPLTEFHKVSRSNCSLSSAAVDVNERALQHDDTVVPGTERQHCPCTTLLLHKGIPWLCMYCGGDGHRRNWDTRYKTRRIDTACTSNNERTCGGVGRDRRAASASNGSPLARARVENQWPTEQVRGLVVANVLPVSLFGQKILQSPKDFRWWLNPY